MYYNNIMYCVLGIYFYLIKMLYIDVLSIILHDTCIHHSNVCDIYRNSCILLFNLYMQCHYIAFLLILLEYYTSPDIFRVYIFPYIFILDIRNWVMALVINPLTLHSQKRLV